MTKKRSKKKGKGKGGGNKDVEMGVMKCAENVEIVEDILELKSDPTQVKHVRTCQGAIWWNFRMLFCCMFFLVCPFGVVLPLMLIFGESIDKEIEMEVSLIVGIILIALLPTIGIIWVVWGLRGFISDTLSPPEPFPMEIPFQGMEKKAWQKSQIKVKRILCIVNPYSGQGRGKKVLNEAKGVLEDEHGIEVDVVETESAGHAFQIAREKKDLSSYDAIVVCGGDGTLHEVVNGLFNRRAPKKGKKRQTQVQKPFETIPPLAILPGGTGNSVAWTMLGGRASVEDLTRAIAEGLSVPMDVNFLELSGQKSEPRRGIYSVNVIGQGIVGDTGILGEKNRWLGTKRYDVCALWLVLKNFQSQVTISVETETNEVVEMHLNTLSFFVNLTQWFGLGYLPTPMSVLDDGLMEFCITTEERRGHVLSILTQMKRGGHVEKGCIEVHKCKKVSAKCHRGPGVLLVDGEIYPHSGSFAVECIPSAFNLLVPKKCLK